MDESKALDIVMRPADGADPRAGAPLPAESPYQNPETIRALFMAVPALKSQQKYKENDRAEPEGDDPAKRT